MAPNKLWLCRTAPKLKHTALKEIFYQLLNTSLLLLHIIAGIIVAVINFKVVE